MEKYCPSCSKRFPEALTQCPDDGSPLVRVPEDNLVGQTVDRRYKIVEVIGKGGMGIVYRAEHQILKRPVALKVVRTDIVQDEDSVKRFLTEARAIASLESPHTVTIYDSGVTETGALYYTMELLEGQALSKLLRKRGAIAYPRAVDIACQVCDSLQEAHAKGIVHRDIKPDNIFITRSDEREFVKLVDFGIAKLLDESGDGAVTRSGVVCGTPRYLSPEQISGEKPGPPTDLYALAVVLYEMLAGAPPFAGPTPAKLMQQHLREMPPPLLDKAPAAVTPALDAVLRRALEKEPANRPATAAQFKSALQAALGEVNVDAATLMDTPITPALTKSPLSRAVGDADAPTATWGSASVFTDDETLAAPVTDQAAFDPTLEAPLAGGVDTAPQSFQMAAPTSQAGAVPTKSTGLLWGLVLGVGLALGVAVVVLWAVGWRPGGAGTTEAPPGSQQQVAAPTENAEQPSQAAQQPSQAMPAQAAGNATQQPAGAEDVTASPDVPHDTDNPGLQGPEAQPQAPSGSPDIVVDARSDVAARAAPEVQPSSDSAPQAAKSRPQTAPEKVPEQRPRKTKHKRDQKRKTKTQDDWFDDVDKLPE